MAKAKRRKMRNAFTDEMAHTGIKEYSDWPTIPQLYINKEFVGGCDILKGMHKDGSLAELLAEKKVIVEDEPEVPSPSSSSSSSS
jgi:monothiol glutaredoxin